MMVSMIMRGIRLAAALVVAAWLLGRLVSDRYGWSQWLLWIPTPAVLVVAVAALVAGIQPDARRPGRRRRRVLVWAAGVAAIFVYFAAIEHRLFRRAPGGDVAMRLVHGSVQATGPKVLADWGEQLTRLGGDVTIVSTLLPQRDIGRLLDRLGGLGTPVVSWPFVLVTRLPVLEARPLVANAGLRMSVFRIDTTESLGRVLTVWAVDLPSDPGRSRASVARAARRILDQVQSSPPDVVVGDFNMTRGSASLSMTFPGLAHAFDQAGRGYGASFRRGLPLYHIDHTLLGENVRAVGYDLVDIGTGRHLVQVVDLAR